MDLGLIGMNSRQRNILRRYARLSAMYWSSTPFSRYNYSKHDMRKAYQKQLKRDLNWLVKNGYLTRSRSGSVTSRKTHYKITKKGADAAHMVNRRNKRMPQLKSGPLTYSEIRRNRMELERI